MLIGVLYGGNSTEREISIKSGLAVLKALRKTGKRAVGIDIKGNPISQIAKEFPFPVNGKACAPHVRNYIRGI